MKIKSGRYDIVQMNALLEQIEHSTKNSDGQSIENDSDVGFGLEEAIRKMLEKHLEKYALRYSKNGTPVKTMHLFIPPEPEEGDENWVDFASFELINLNNDDYRELKDKEKFIVCEYPTSFYWNEDVPLSQLMTNDRVYTKKGTVKECNVYSAIKWVPFDNRQQQDLSLKVYRRVWNSRFKFRSSGYLTAIYFNDLPIEEQKRIFEFVKKKLRNDAAFLSEFLNKDSENDI